MNRAFPAFLLLVLAAPAAARDSLGVFGGWGAFRDANPARCYAIAEPDEGGSGGSHRPFAAISWWPKNGVKGQIHFRLRYDRGDGRDVMLHVGSKRWRLAPGKGDAWAPSARHDAYIIAKIRQSTSMSISTTGPKGGRFTDVYALQGAASAMDAAALGCARAR